MNSYKVWLKYIDVMFDYDVVAVLLPRHTSVWEELFSFDRMIVKSDVKKLNGYHADGVVIFKEEVSPWHMKHVIRPMVMHGGIQFIGDVR